MSVAAGLVGLPVHLHLDVDVPRGVGAFLPGTLLAVLAAVLFAVGSVLQHEAAETTHADDGGFRVRALVRRPKWLIGQLSTMGGSGLHVAALALAPVAIVQPLLAAALIVALGIRSVRIRCWPAGSEWFGAALTAGGLAVFLIAARPAPGAPHRLPHAAAVIGVVLLGLAVVGLASRTGRGAVGALVCGVTGGLAAGIGAVLVSSALKVLAERGLAPTLATTELWGALLMAVTAQLGAQQAYARGSLSWSLPALTVIDPLAAVPAARFLLGERLQPGHAAVWVPAGAIAALGIVFLARSGATAAATPITRMAPAPEQAGQ